MAGLHPASNGMKKFLPYGIISITTALVLSLSLSQGLFFGSEHFFSDLLISPQKVDSRIVIVSIDSESLARIGQWPWPRAVFARAFNTLAQAKPAGVGLDVILADKSRYGATDDATLASALRTVSYPLVFPVETVVTLQGETPRATSAIFPITKFVENRQIISGHVNLLVDKDGVVRSVPGSIVSGEQVIQPFAYQLAKQVGTSETLGAINPIVYSQPTGNIRRIPFYRLLDSATLGDTLRGKLVLIGATAPDLHDDKLTPFSRGTLMPGVEIQANILNMLISGYKIVALPLTLAILVLFIAALIPTLLFWKIKSSWRPVVISMGIGALYNFAIIAAYGRGLSINLIHTNLAWILATLIAFSYRYFIGEREKRQLKNVFSKYVSGAVLEKILQDPKGVKLGGEEKTITVLFSDIRGFTTLSEKVTPQDLVRILNKYFTLMTGEVLKYGGVLDKYIGDAVMAFWGAPLDDEDQANNALRASLGMLERLKELNRELEKEEGVTIDIGIGIYTGKAVVGNIGSSQRFDYTAMGDTVNVASRLEGLNKEHKTHLIVGDSTKQKITESTTFLPLGSVSVKGRAEQVVIYTIQE